jgi:CBS domain containing-hemolysin-like protein
VLRLPPSITLASGPLSPALVPSDLVALPWILTALLASVFFGALRAALHHCHPERVLGREPSAERRLALAPMLERAEELAASASILKISCDLVFLTLVVGLVSPAGPLGWTDLGLALALGAPTLLLFTEALPLSLARARGDRLLLVVLPTFNLLQAPMGLLVAGLNLVRRAMLRMMRLPDNPPAAQRIVESLREVIEDAGSLGDLEATQRELIENVMSLAHVDVAAIMTPRTEIQGIEVSQSTANAAELLAATGHSHVPVYEESVDTIIGTISARELVRTFSSAEATPATLREILRPAYFVPETKQVSELLTEFRSKKQKMAIVLDEYGGTAGVVTLTDALAEVVGKIDDEFGESGEPILRREDGTVEVTAALHVSEVNEALGLEIPEEEDFETLGGFVLAELGHLPKKGERFRHGDVVYMVSDASDRRVLKVEVKLPA